MEYCHVHFCSFSKVYTAVIYTWFLQSQMIVFDSRVCFLVGDGWRWLVLKPKKDPFKRWRSTGIGFRTRPAAGLSYSACRLGKTLPGDKVFTQSWIIWRTKNLWPQGCLGVSLRRGSSKRSSRRCKWQTLWCRVAGWFWSGHQPPLDSHGLPLPISKGLTSCARQVLQNAIQVHLESTAGD